MNSPKKKKQVVRPSPTRGSASAENDLFTKAMLEEITAYISHKYNLKQHIPFVYYMLQM